MWALHLSLLPDPPSAEPYFHARGEGLLDEDVKGKGKAKATTPETDERLDPRNVELRKENEGTISQSSSSSSGEDEDADEDERKLPSEHDPELEELLRANSEVSSSSSSSDEEDDRAKQPIPKKKPSRNKARYKREGPASTLVVLALGCWILRIPVLYRDLRRCVAYISYEIAFSPRVNITDLSNHTNYPT